MLSACPSDTLNMLRRPVLSLAQPVSGPLVLIVEDEPVSRLVTWSTVQVLCEVDAAIACNGEEALEDVRNAEFDLILMDIDMPVLGGFAATAGIRQLERQLGRASRAPIVAHTSRANALRMTDPERFELDGVLEKPASLERMEECFLAWCRGYRQWAARRPGLPKGP